MNNFTQEIKSQFTSVLTPGVTKGLKAQNTFLTDVKNVEQEIKSAFADRNSSEVSR